MFNILCYISYFMALISLFFLMKYVVTGVYMVYQINKINNKEFG